MKKFFQKIGLFFKNLCRKYVSDKKFRSTITTIIELPLIICGFIFNNFKLVFWSLLIVAVINAIINALIKKFIKDNN